MILYTSQTTSRLQYIVDFVFREVMGIDCQITNSIKEFEDSNLFKLNYSNETIASSQLSILPNELLFETNIVEQEIEFSEWNALPCFFKTADGEVPFDILAASFYLISRYEEYLPYTPDMYQRYPSTDSLAFKHNFLSLPLIDLWCKELKQLILSINSTVHFREPVMKFIPTYDIDIAYSYLGKGWKRTLGGALRDLLSGNISLIQERIRVFSNQQKDPFDSFDFLDELHSKYLLKPIYFFLLSRGGRLDKNLAPHQPLMKQLIHRISQKYLIGIHPSYQSHDDVSILKQEISLLNASRSRQHYIRFQLPVTFRNLINLGIAEDYSMGYGSVNGFRASTSFTHQWFDLEKNEITSLKLFSFCYMECNSFFEQKLNADQAYDEMKHYANVVRSVGGNLITIWHNFSLGSDPMWKGWKEKYHEFVKALA